MAPQGDISPPKPLLPRPVLGAGVPRSPGLRAAGGLPCCPLRCPRSGLRRRCLPRSAAPAPRLPLLGADRGEPPSEPVTEATSSPVQGTAGTKPELMCARGALAQTRPLTRACQGSGSTSQRGEPRHVLL
ncbi:hypothetical protein NDU88_004006 [Pleurodeles waltl]|uniref:Uncharacterized protein n=1 Tax=Pleurodeles waltl TaxID=8319 RepID=A0AAV7LII9_PLEWA|nr:hypothetical protein NDU88_004006 [Pleurodeles waltl]